MFPDQQLAVVLICVLGAPGLVPTDCLQTPARGSLGFTAAAGARWAQVQRAGEVKHSEAEGTAPDKMQRMLHSRAVLHA